MSESEMEKERGREGKTKEPSDSCHKICQIDLGPHCEYNLHFQINMGTWLKLLMTDTGT